MKIFLIVLIFLIFLSVEGVYIESWVPAYGITKSETRLNTQYGNYTMDQGLTHLSLQFWIPDGSGGLDWTHQFESGKNGDDSSKVFVDWANGKNVKVMLCVFNLNKDGSWDWELAKSGFETYRSTFINSLVDEVERLDLDGVDIDFETTESSKSEDRDSFVEFLKDLGEALRAKGKDLFVNTFAYIWNAPNQDWWELMFEHVTGINSMGYDEIGRNGDTWSAYSFSKDAAGTNSTQLMLGMPGWVSTWKGDVTIDQLKWFEENKEVGISIWDAQILDSSWQTEQVWELIASLKPDATPTPTPSSNQDTNGAHMNFTFSFTFCLLIFIALLSF
ncbi:sporulation-specific chitinase 2 [Anaeramoeba flamelloides]|uniref:Sporulation-specific chitinase 2 n=1 Tax=Anaeramoeba flamelloides TaxID=1746091 RepID=A0ABQ8ZG96_9EUKA|nr:sporulation-specific chitinase 2 [Anaeramoeba flamelloides]